MKNKIKMVRMKLNLSQREFGRLLGVTGSYISQVESGKIKPSRDLVTRICRTFGVSKDGLENGTGDMMPEGDHLSPGERLKTARLKRRYTQCELAKIVECSRNSISATERGETTPTANLIKKLCQALWINESWLRFGMGSMERSEIVAEVLDIIRENNEVRSAVEQYMRRSKDSCCI